MLMGNLFVGSPYLTALPVSTNAILNNRCSATDRRLLHINLPFDLLRMSAQMRARCANAPLPVVQLH